MPFLTKTIRYKLRNTKFTKAKLEKYNLNYPINIMIDIPLYDFKLLFPRHPSIYAQCICDDCKKQFSLTIDGTWLDDIKNNHVLCVSCRLKRIYQKRHNMDYPLAVFAPFHEQKRKEKEQNKKRT